MHLSFKPSGDDVTRINFRFRFLVTWSSPHGRDTSSHKIWRIYLYTIRSYWHFSEIKDGGGRHLGFVGGAMGPPTKAYSLCVLPVKMSSWSAKLFLSYKDLNFLSFRLESPIHTPKINFFGVFYHQNLGAHRSDPQKAHPCVISCLLSYHAWKSINRSDLCANRRKKV